MANLLIQSIWFFFFQAYTWWGWILSTLDIFAMLATAVYMMMVSTRSEVNGWEWVFVRSQLSIYSGWLTAASILNVVLMLKFFGVEDPDLTWLDEEQLSVGLLWIALGIYNLASYIELNPLFGAIFLWVIFTIRNKVMDERPEKTMLISNLEYIGVTHLLTMTGLLSSLSTVSIYDVGDLTRGLFY